MLDYRSLHNRGQNWFHAWEVYWRLLKEVSTNTGIGTTNTTGGHKTAPTIPFLFISSGEMEQQALRFGNCQSWRGVCLHLGYQRSCWLCQRSTFFTDLWICSSCQWASEVPALSTLGGSACDPQSQPQGMCSKHNTSHFLFIDRRTQYFLLKMSISLQMKAGGKAVGPSLAGERPQGAVYGPRRAKGAVLDFETLRKQPQIQIPSPQNGGYWFIHSCKFSEILEIKIMHTLWSYLKHSYFSLYYLSCSSKPSTSFSIKTTVSFGWYKLQLCYCKLITWYHQEEPTT